MSKCYHLASNNLESYYLHLNQGAHLKSRITHSYTQPKQRAITSLYKNVRVLPTNIVLNALLRLCLLGLLMEYIRGICMQVILYKSTLTFLSLKALDPLFHIMPENIWHPKT